jgi:hypothetical protein
MPNSAPGSPSTRFSLSPAERSKLYLRRFGGRRGTHRIKITDQTVRGLLKRGYLGPNELDDIKAIKQAVNLFLCDSLSKPPARSLHRQRQADMRSLASNRANR